MVNDVGLISYVTLFSQKGAEIFKVLKSFLTSMIMFIYNKSTKFYQITLRIKRFVHERKVVPFFTPRGVVVFVVCDVN